MQIKEITTVSTDVSIAEIVGFLKDRAPQALADLRSRNESSDALSILDTGSVLGDEDASAGLLRVKCDAALAALEQATKELPPLVQGLLQRVRRANSWEIGGSMLGLLGSGSAIATLLPSVAEPQRAQWAAAMALIGSVVALAPKALRKTSMGTVDGAMKLVVEAQDALARADQISPLLRYALKDNTALRLTEVQDAIKTANELARRCRQMPLEGV